jgi:hypothetical protein
MFEFMVLQCVTIALLIAFPRIATYLPDQLRAGAAAEKTEQIDDSGNRLEEDPYKAVPERSMEPTDAGVPSTSAPDARPEGR